MVALRAALLIVVSTYSALAIPCDAYDDVTGKYIYFDEANKAAHPFERYGYELQYGVYRPDQHKVEFQHANIFDQDSRDDPDFRFQIF